MSQYRNMFYDKRLNRVVEVGLDLDDMIVESNTTGDTESQSVEYDIKNGHIMGEGHYTPAYIEAPLLYELSSSQMQGFTERSITERILTDAEIGARRNISGAFHVLFDMYILTRPKDEGMSTSNRGRFWYTVSAGMVATYTRSGRGAYLNHFLLKRDGARMTNLQSKTILPNVFSGGETCHGGMGEVRRWREDHGKSEGHPDTLAKTYEMFKSSVGNNDLRDTNYTTSIELREVKEILLDFQRSYVDNLTNEERRDRFTQYIESFIGGLERAGLGGTRELNVNQLGSILEHSETFYIEDYV